MNKFRIFQPTTRIAKAFNKIRTPFEKFVHDEASSGLLLMACAILAMVFANTGLAAVYDSVLGTKVILQFGDFKLSHSIHHWINDGLMALFFFVVGLEIKREILVGELADLRQAVLPIAAAIGGMMVPAVLFLVFNFGGEGQGGWAIPMATDIAFAIGVMVLLGDRVPKALIGFLLALAIVDDLGAIIIIALFYTSSIAWWALSWAAVFLFLLICCNRAGIRTPLPYFLLGGGLWLMMLQSGIHATLAGVITALTVPANSNCLPEMFTVQMKRLTEKFKQAEIPGKSIMENSEQQAVLQNFDTTIHAMATPLQRLEHQLHLWVSFLIVPIFALANAGVRVELATLGESLMHPVTFGIIVGLVGGKFLGVFVFSWLVIRMGVARLPHGMSLSHVAGVGLLAGIGFTMAIFIGELAFIDHQDLLMNAKMGIIAASLIAGSCGYTWLRMVGGKR